ncbi:MAG: hypothetical protein KDC54_01460, partial [Lewinella sp.]|nr:hypothetical protein [Lewinella sp.]
NVGDQRWNYQAFQGLIVDGGSLPGNLNFDLFWGKMQPNGGLPNAASDPLATVQNPLQAGNVPTYQGFAGTRRALASYITGGRLGRTMGAGNTLNYNVIYSQTTLDSITKSNWNFQVHSLSLDWTFGDGINLTGELGMGHYDSPTTNLDWGEALMLRLRVPRKYTWLPLDLQLYQISKDFYNPNGEINTNSNPAIQGDAPAEIAAGQASAGGQLTQINQLAHNRRGLNLNTGWETGPLKLNFGWGLAAEIDTLTTQLSYVHRINGLALSRIYNPFPANAVRATNFGPYGRKYSFFRGIFEQVYTTDLNPAAAEAQTLKYYNVVDLQAKLRTKVLDRNLYLFYLGNLNSASSSAKAWPVLNDESYLYVQYHELDLYYELFPRFVVAGYLGLERAQGGRFTEWGENQLPRDQTGIGIGGGFDWTLSDATGLYFRYRHMQFEDKNFELDHFQGHEITIELKTFF